MSPLRDVGRDDGLRWEAHGPSVVAPSAPLPPHVNSSACDPVGTRGGGVLEPLTA